MAKERNNSRRARSHPPVADKQAGDGSHRYVQSCIAHVGFPATIDELRRAYEAGDGYTDLELLVDPPDDHQGGWTAPRWLTTGDVMFFYHTKRARLRIERLLARARGPANKEWGTGESLRASIDFLEDQLALADRFAGTVFGCTSVVGVAAFEPGDADRHWRSNIYAPIDRVHVFDRPLPDTAFGSRVKISPGGALTPLHGDAFTGLRDLLAATNDLPDFLRDARPGGLGFRDVDATNWMAVACSASARFIDESQLRAYLVDHLLEAIKDVRTVVHRECRCEVARGHPCYADYFVRVGGVWLPVEAKLNVSAERDLPSQVSRYLGVGHFVPTLGNGKGRRVDGPCASHCLVVDATGLYLVTSNGYLGCGPDRPLWKRTRIDDGAVAAIREYLCELRQ